MRMRHRRTQHEGMRHPRQDHVVGVAAPPGDKTQILMTPHRLTDAELHAVSSHSNFVTYRTCSARDQSTDRSSETTCEA
jgi:hypothetical protein